MKKKYDYLIVGSGLFGATFNYLATRRGKSCLVIEKRSHLGGNLYCETIEGIHVHKYGAHIFHTNNKEVWQLVNSIVPFNRFTNSPLANYQGRLYNLPFNMNTFYQMWGTRMPEMAQCKIDEQRQEAVRQMKAAGVDIPRNLEEQALLLVGRDIYEALIKGYTEKQWGRRCCDLPAFIIKRLPLRFTYDNNYFNDRYQGIPIGGYNPLIEGLLSGTMCLNNTDFFADRGYWQEQAEHIVYTGPIDEYFDFQFGKLNYRTLRFEHELIPVANYQGNAVVNFTDRNIPYTRIIEHKHFEMFGDMVYKIPSTIVTREYPSEWQEGFEPYYPVNDDRNDRIATQYKQLAARERSIIFGGRLAEYKYYDMAPIMERAIQINKSL